MKYFCIGIVIVIMNSAVHAESLKNDRVEEALSVLKTFCVTGGTSLEVKASGGGNFQIKRITNSGISGQVNLSYKELQGLVDLANETNAKQASEMRVCMKPYLEKIMNIILDSK